MNWDIIFALVFYGLLFLFFLWKRERFEVQGGIFALYRTKLGLRWMERLAGRFPRLLRVLGVIGIVIGFLGMGVMVYFLLVGAWGVLVGKAPLLSPVLPGIEIAPGIPKLGFWHWVISIFLVAVIHEFSHGVLARLFKIKVKSSGFAFLGPILAAFVEPDEKQLAKKSRKEQLAIFAAGPFSNVVLGLIFLVITGMLGTVAYGTLDFHGVKIAGFEKNSVLEQAGLQQGEIILKVNGQEIVNAASMSKIITGISPGDSVDIVTNKQTYRVVAAQHPQNEKRAYLGVSLVALGYQQEHLERYGLFWLDALFWVYLLCWWIYTISIGVGIFNLVPLGPVDGGRMWLTALTWKFSEERAKKIWKYTSLAIVLLIVINLMPWIIKLLTSILNALS